MASKRKRKSARSESFVKKQKQSNDPISSVSNTTAQCFETSPISYLHSELLTQVLSHILAANPKEPITLHSTTGRRWRNELHALTTVDWNQSISVSSSYMRDHIPPPRKSARSDLLDVLLVSRAFYFAGIDAFFGGNVFALEDLRHLDKLTTTLDLDRRRSIRHLVFQIPMVETSFLWKQTPAAVGAQLSASFERLPSLQAAKLAVAWNFRHAVFLPTENPIIAFYRDRWKEVERVKQYCHVTPEVLDVEIDDCEGNVLNARNYEAYEQ